jgi:hypothetical protein
MLATDRRIVGERRDVLHAEERLTTNRTDAELVAASPSGDRCIARSCHDRCRVVRKHDRVAREAHPVNQARRPVALVAGDRLAASAPRTPRFARY